MRKTGSKNVVTHVVYVFNWQKCVLALQHICADLYRTGNMIIEGVLVYMVNCGSTQFFIHEHGLFQRDSNLQPICLELDPN